VVALPPASRVSSHKSPLTVTLADGIAAVAAVANASVKACGLTVSAAFAETETDSMAAPKKANARHMTSLTTRTTCDFSVCRPKGNGSKWNTPLRLIGARWIDIEIDFFNTTLWLAVAGAG
jgi:hypothetical protein